jgi:hypothetical protein
MKRRAALSHRGMAILAMSMVTDIIIIAGDMGGTPMPRVD